MATENKPSVTISIEAPLVPFGQFHIRVTEPGQQSEDTRMAPVRPKTPPYRLPASTGDNQRLIIHRGASG